MAWALLRPEAAFLSFYANPMILDNRKNLLSSLSKDLATDVKLYEDDSGRSRASSRATLEFYS